MFTIETGPSSSSEQAHVLTQCVKTATEAVEIIDKILASRSTAINDTVPIRHYQDGKYVSFANLINLSRIERGLHPWGNLIDHPIGTDCQS